MQTVQSNEKQGLPCPQCGQPLNRAMPPEVRKVVEEMREKIPYRTGQAEDRVLREYIDNVNAWANAIESAYEPKGEG